MFESRNNLLPVNFFQFRLKVFLQTKSIFLCQTTSTKKIVSTALGLFAFFNAILQKSYIKTILSAINHKGHSKQLQNFEAKFLDYKNTL
jgi:hypothetical protein